MSSPAWGRGLKLISDIVYEMAPNVVPRVGTWIEMVGVRGIIINENVVPRVGTWIEISC